jgi:hypothetical protein
LEIENLDLNIENYSLIDIYNLFKIKSVLNDESLKNAKRIVLRTHPDKSKLDSKYFIFFSIAYKKLYHIYEFQNNSSIRRNTTEYVIEKKKNEKILKEFIKKNKLEDVNNFNHWFNKEFENNYKSDLNDGYSEWLKGDEDIFKEDNFEGNNTNEKIENYKKNMIIEVNDVIKDLNSDILGGTVLGENISNYSSGLFDNGLPYNDLKDAHKNSLLNVREDPQKKKFNNATEFKIFRDSEKYNILNEEESFEYFKQKENESNETSTQVAYQLTKEYEDNIKKQSKLWSKMQHIRND